MAVIVSKIVNGKWHQNCYVVHNGLEEAIIIDPGSQAERISTFLERRRLRVLAILATHAHHDHVSAVTDIQARSNVPFYLHSADLSVLRRLNLYRNVFDGDDPIKAPTVDHEIDHENLPLRIGEFSIGVMFTPGHTPGGTCFLIGSDLFTGDTILKGKIGRVDLPGGDEASLRDSLRRLSTLAPQTVLYPGHGESTTIEIENRNNHKMNRLIK